MLFNFNLTLFCIDQEIMTVVLRSPSNSFVLDDDNTRISHVFEMRIGMNEFDHRILALLKQHRERPEKSF